MKNRLLAFTALLSPLALAVATTANAQALPVPMLIELEQARKGNPLAGYAALVELEKRYQQSSQFAAIYPEIRLMAEEFLGIPDAGLRAMSTIEQLRRTF